jgi:taurine--2-oxoglutarate transaminase
MLANEKIKPTNQEIIQINRDHVFFSWSVQKSIAPIPVVGGEGIYFWDAEGRRYMDFSSQLMNLNIGYQHPKVVAAIQEQAATLCAANPSNATEPKGELGRMLCEIAPGNLNKVLFTLGGADANENAIKFARAYTGRNKIIVRYRSYHGATFGALTLTGDWRRQPFEPGIPGIVRAFDPYCYRCTFGQEPDTCAKQCLTHIEEIIQYEGPDRVAAVFLEGITGTNGILVPPEDYWPRLRQMTRKYGILLISDEVMSGFGRTGEWFSVDHWNVVPDIITFAKGVTAGYLPLGGVLVSQEIADYFDDKMLAMGLTYCGHPMSTAAGVATIKVYQEEGLLENSRRLGNILAQELDWLQEKYDIVGEVRHIGLFSCLELVKDRQTRQPVDLATMNAIKGKLISENLSTFLPGNLIFVCPPLVIKEAELREGLEIIEHAIASVS